MNPKKTQVLSAEVLLKSASGKRVTGKSVITAETLKDYAPSQETVTAARNGFANLGYQTGSMVGISFSITAPVSVFEHTFRVKLREGKKGGIEVVRSGSPIGLELPIDSLPAALQSLVTSITFTPPPDFGPGRF